MSFDLIGRDVGVEVADADLSTKQYYVAKLTSTGVVLAAAITNVVHGVIQNKPVSGAPVSLRVAGVSKVKSGGTVTKGSPVYLKADGTVEAAATSTARLIGTALSSGASGDVVPVLLTVLDASTPQAS